jgi:hypothetical protein
MNSEEFIAWALDPSRTVEETFTAELLTEYGLMYWMARNIPHGQRNHRSEMDVAAKRREHRRYNPAYVPVLRREDVERAAQYLGEVNYWSHMASYDRALGDLQALKVLTTADNIHLNDVLNADLSPLAELPALKKLHLGTAMPQNTQAIGKCLRLEEFHLRCATPWPESFDLERLPRLKRLMWGANIFLLEEIPCLPALELLTAGEGASYTDLPLRHMGKLPDMPLLKYLRFAPVGDLRGIEKFETLQALDIEGFIPSLEPLSALKNLTHLKLTLHKPVSLKPIAALPELRWLMIRSDLPFDYSPLADLPNLHELKVPCWLPSETERDAPPPVDVVTIRSLLEPWDQDFAGLLIPPRPLPELRTIVIKDGGPGVFPTAFPAGSLPLEENHHMQAALRGWLGRRMIAALDALLGRGWRVRSECEEDEGVDEGEDTASSGLSDIPGAGIGGHYSECSMMLEFNRAEDAERLPEIIDCIRRVWAVHPWNWSAVIMVNLNPEWVRDPDHWKSPLRRRWEEYQEETRDYEEGRRKKREHEERVLRLQMAKEAGHEIKSEDFAPDAVTHDLWQGEAALKEEQNDLNDAGTGDDEGGVAVAEADPEKDQPEEHPLGDAYNLYATLYMDAIVAPKHQSMALTILMGREPEMIELKKDQPPEAG